MSGAPPPPLRWWGWGDRQVPVPPGLLTLLREECGIDGSIVSRAPLLSDVRMPDCSLPSELRSALVEICGSLNVRSDEEERIRHAGGRSYLDLLRLRSATLDAAPDAVVHPANHAEVAAVIAACAAAGCAVVPFGGGTSVVGGVTTPLRSPCVAVDTDRLDALTNFDSTSLLATLGAGMRGPRIEAELNARGVTLGHFPQSFEYATAGGFAATRSAGQASAGYGRFDAMVRGLTMASPAGECNVRAEPPSATGPSLLQMLVGSEGALGLITGVTVRVRPDPAARRYAGWSFPIFEEGAAAFRELAQHQHLPDVARLSDADETRAGFAMSESGMTRFALRYLEARGQPRPCLAILGWEGSTHDIGARMHSAGPMLRRHGAISLGTSPGRSWLRDRFAAPYLRDALLDRGVLVETLETGATWSRLDELRNAVTSALLFALRRHGTWPLVGCHVSHLYPEGASLYFTILAPQAPDPVSQWHDAKRAATDAIVDYGGVLSHHHGIGRDHAAWLPLARGESAMSCLRALKRELDPAAIMNPGALVST
ncbi:MAG: FAD-binding oxidoreductase [Candidatus Dormibacteraeota bacterium]|nr:FAD-binding oxidoreductase [Candidatus Dormibacteraeota bacterium]